MDGFIFFSDSTATGMSSDGCEISFARELA